MIAKSENVTVHHADGVADVVKFSGVIEGGFCWDAITKDRLNNPKALEQYGYKVYSQNDEDGIIHEIFRRIGTTSKKFIEFGVENGLECNTHLLLFYGWRGLWIEGSSDSFDEINMRFKPVIESGELKVLNSFITKDNINSLFMEAEFTGEVDLLSIDIDGNDYYIWDSIEVVNPRVVITEYNGKFPPDLEWCQAYDENHVWRGKDWHGASLKSFEKLACKKGYRLVGTDLRGCNAFFVRCDLAKNNFYEPATSEELYNPLRINLCFSSNHPAEYCLAKQTENFGLLNYQDYDLVEGFHSIEYINDQKHVWTSSRNSKMRVLGRSGTDIIEIPYRLPQEALLHTSDFIVKIHTGLSRDVEYLVDKPFGVLKIHFDKTIQYETVIEICIELTSLWSPKDVLESSDSRMLGIDIILSDIKQYCTNYDIE